MGMTIMNTILEFCTENIANDINNAIQRGSIPNDTLFF